MSANLRTERQQCRDECPLLGFTFTDKGDVARCSHGEVFVAFEGSHGWGYRHGKRFYRRVPPWRRRKHAKALAALAEAES